MLPKRPILFTFVFSGIFIVLLAVYTFSIFNLIMPKAEIYKDEYTDVTISLPGGWYDGGTLNGGTRCFSKGDILIFYNWEDYWAQHDMQIARESVDNSFFSDEDIQSLFLVPIKNASHNGTEYFTFTATSSKDGYFLAEAFCYKNGIQHTFSMVYQSALELRNFSIFLDSVSYPDNFSSLKYISSADIPQTKDSLDPFNANSRMTDLFQRSQVTYSAQKTSKSIAFHSILITSMLYLLIALFFVIRLDTSSICSTRKTFIIMAFIYTVICGFALTLSYFWLGQSLWFGMQAVALGGVFLFSIMVLTKESS